VRFVLNKPMGAGKSPNKAFVLINGPQSPLQTVEQGTEAHV
jgi:hypothetical protein